MMATRVECSASDQVVSPWRTVFSGVSSSGARRLAVKDSPVIVPRSKTLPAMRLSFCWACSRIELSHCLTNAWVMVFDMDCSEGELICSIRLAGCPRTGPEFAHWYRLPHHWEGYFRVSARQCGPVNCPQWSRWGGVGIPT